MNQSVASSTITICLSLLLAVVVQPLSLLAQEEETAHQATLMTPPAALDDDFHKWMIGEWQGTTTSSMGNAQISLKIEWGLDRQFVIIHETSTFEGMTYKGVGIFTRDPTSGDFNGHWFDNLRGVYKGTGKWEGDSVVMAWESPMGTEARTTEKASDDKMVMKFKTKSPTGEEVEGRTELTRVAMGNKSQS